MTYNIYPAVDESYKFPPLVRGAIAGYAELLAAFAAKGPTEAHIARTDNPHAVTKTQVGLGNVDNIATDSNATAGRVIVRDVNGRAKVADPSASGDIVTKNYVDTRLPADTGWVLMTMNTAGGWTHSTAFSWDSFKARYKNGYVTLNGRVNKSASWAVGDIVAGLPSGVPAPPARVLGNPITVQADGNVIINVAGGAAGDTNMYACYPV